MIRVRRLTDEGLRRFGAFLDSFDTDGPRPLSDLPELLRAADATEHVPNVVQVDERQVFARRYDLAEYLHRHVPGLGLADPTRDAGLWAWLAALWFEQLAPPTRTGRKIGERARWVPDIGNARRTYRHLVLGPYELYRANADDPSRALCVLIAPPHTPGEMVGQFAAKEDIANAKAVLAVATRLYIDLATQKPKRGAGGSAAGSPRRFNAVLGQFDRTYDLQSISGADLLALLPKEFSRFRDQQAVQARSK